MALASGLFERIRVVTDDRGISDAPFAPPLVHMMRRSAASATDDAPDYLWLSEALAYIKTDTPSKMALSVIDPDHVAMSPVRAVMILRPTSPFRTVDMLRRAWRQFERSEVHSLRAVEPITEHPGKMWTCDGPGYPMVPVLDRSRDDGTPWHSSPTQSLPHFYRQNASLEIVWAYVVETRKSISGTKIAPFFTDGYEGFDINTEADWARAEQAIIDHPELLELVMSRKTAIQMNPDQVLIQ